MRRFILALGAALAIGACASSYAPHTITGGFEARRVSDTVWSVAYNGNSYTTDETVQTYWLHRCAEIAVEQGYDGFEIISNIQLSSASGANTVMASYEREAVFTSIVERGIDGKPYMVGNIRLLRAPVPTERRNTFDAQALLAFLGPYVRGDLCGGNVCPHVHRYLFPGFGQDT